MTGIETALLIASTAVAAGGAVVGGMQASAAHKAEASAMESRADEERAAASREAATRARNAQMVLSRQQAVAAASGGGGSDKTVLDIMGDTAAEGDYQSRSAVYEGDARGRGLEDQAAISRMQARQAMVSGFIEAGGSMLSGGHSWASSRPGGSKFSGSKLPTLHYG